jgi:hypothetical protein
MVFHGAKRAMAGAAMRNGGILAAVLLMAGCNSPSIDLYGFPARKVTVGSSQFSVFTDGRTAQAVRTSVEFGPAAAGVIARGHRAIELATGCQIIPGSFDGDPALMRAKLFCPNPV